MIETGGASARSESGVSRIRFGRFMLPDLSEHSCQILELTVDGAHFISSHVVPPDQPIVAYIEVLGRIEAVSGEPVGGGFHVTFSLTGNRRNRIAEKLRNSAQNPEDGNSEELPATPPEQRKTRSMLTLADGRAYPCEVLDISTVGADIRIDVLPNIGSSVMLGKMKGRVARFLETGVGIEFGAPPASQEQY